MGIMKWKCQKIGDTYSIVAEQKFGVMDVARCGFEISVMAWRQANCQRILLEGAILWIKMEMSRCSKDHP